MAALVSLPVWLACDPRRGRQVSPVSLRYCSATVSRMISNASRRWVRFCARSVVSLQLARLDLGAVLGALEVAQLGHQPVGGAVEAAYLAVEHVDEAPEQALALVGELEPVRRDALREDAERLRHGVQRVVAVPELAAVELVALGGRAEELGVVADARGGGLSCGLDGLDIEGHDDLP